MCMFYFHNNLLYSHKAVPSWLPLVPVQASSAFTARENALLRGKVFKKLMLYLICFFSNFLNQIEDLVYVREEHMLLYVLNVYQTTPWKCYTQ